jgi:hypothetical protein
VRCWGCGWRFVNARCGQWYLRSAKNVAAPREVGLKSVRCGTLSDEWGSVFGGVWRVGSSRQDALVLLGLHAIRRTGDASAHDNPACARRVG